MAALNQVIFGDGAAVFDVGSAFAYDMPDTDTFRIADGEAVIQGRHVRIAVGEYETVTLTAPETGYNRLDYIALQYQKSTDGTESVTLAQLKGTETSDTSTLPTLVQGSSTDADTLSVYQFPLYTVAWSGAQIGDITRKFTPFSRIPTQINAKQDTIKGGASTVTQSNLTAGFALVSNSSGKIGVSKTTATELGYLSGLKSGVQTQLTGLSDNLKQIGGIYLTAASSNIASKWEWKQLKFTASSRNGTTISVGSISSGSWVVPEDVFLVGHVVVDFAYNSSGVRGVRLVRINSSGTEANIGAGTAAAISHTQQLNVGVFAAVSKGDQLRLDVIQDSGKTLEISATVRLLLIPNV